MKGGTRGKVESGEKGSEWVGCGEGGRRGGGEERRGESRLEEGREEQS